MSGTNYEVLHCEAFSSPHSHPSWAQIFAAGSCFQIPIASVPPLMLEIMFQAHIAQHVLREELVTLWAGLVLYQFATLRLLPYEVSLVTRVFLLLHLFSNTHMITVWSLSPIPLPIVENKYTKIKFNKDHTAEVKTFLRNVRKNFTLSWIKFKLPQPQCIANFASISKFILKNNVLNM